MNIVKKINRSYFPLLPDVKIGAGFRGLGRGGYVNVISVLLLCAMSVFGQTEEVAKSKLLSVNDMFSVSQLQVVDNYLSPSTYAGAAFGFEHATLSLLRADKPQWLKMSSIMGSGAALYNEQRSASMLFAQGAYRWGLNYQYEIMPQFRLLAGGFAELDFAFKNLARNVNNPVNVDLSTNVHAMAWAIYRLHVGRRVVNVNLQCNAPLLGAMFVPQQGGTYYEMFSLWNLRNTLHFSSLHNKQGASAALFVDFDLKRTSWRIGVDAKSVVHTANNHYFRQQTLGAFVGFNYQLHAFSGRNTPPAGNYAKAIVW